MAGLMLNSSHCTRQSCRSNQGQLCPRNAASMNSNCASVFSTLGFSVGGKVGIRTRDRHAPTGQELKWRTPAVGRTSAEEILGDAKRVIDDILMSKGANGVGGLAEVSWALYADERTKKCLGDAVTTLGECRGQDFGEFLKSIDGHGTWEVFYAPHISRLSSAVGIQIRPLRYILTDSGFTSNVRYLSPLGDGWFNAAGDYVVRDGQTVEILFDSFWWDIGRNNLQPDPKGKGSVERTLVNIAGRGAFIPSLSVYPVYYADRDVVIFEFTTLGTKIAARKIGPATAE